MGHHETLSAPSNRPWGFSHDLLRLRTPRARQFIDVTERVADAVRRSGVTDGLVAVQSLHTTAAVVVNENEPLLLEDLGDALDQWASREAAYRHDDFRIRTVNLAPGERENGHAHVQALVLSASVSLGVVGGALQLGRWQRIFLVELDGPRRRTLGVTTMGLTAAQGATRTVLQAVTR